MSCSVINDETIIHMTFKIRIYICYAAIDLGSSTHLYPINNKEEQYDPTADPISVECAYKEVMMSLAEDIN